MIWPLRNCLPEHKFRGESKTRNSATTAVTASHAKQHVSIRVASKLRPAIADYCLLIARTTLLLSYYLFDVCLDLHMCLSLSLHTLTYIHIYRCIHVAIAMPAYMYRNSCMHRHNGHLPRELYN